MKIIKMMEVMYKIIAVGIYFNLNHGNALLQKRPKSCEIPIGIHNGAIDRSQMEFTFYDNETVTSGNHKCDASGKYGPRLYQEQSWCSKLDGDSSLKITFPYLFTVNGIYFEFEDSDFNPDYVKIRYSTSLNGEYLEDVSMEKDTYNIEGYETKDVNSIFFSWNPVTIINLVITLKDGGSSNLRKVNFELYGCSNYDYGEPLLSFSNLNLVTDSSPDGSNFLNQVLLNSAGSGWNPNDISVQQTNSEIEVYWLQIIFPDWKKVFSIAIQQNWNKANGHFWVKYGGSVESLMPYLNKAGTLKVINPPMNNEHMNAAIHKFLNPLHLKVFRLFPICGNEELSCASIKFQLYGVPHDTPDHFWLLTKNRFIDQNGVLDGDTSGMFVTSNGMIQSSHRFGSPLRTNAIPSNDCLINPDVCDDGLTVSTTIKIHERRSGPDRSIKLIKENIRLYGSCKHIGNSKIDLNSEFAVYVHKTDIAPYQYVQSSYLRFRGYEGTENTLFSIDAEIHIGLSQSHSDQCQGSGFRTPFKKTANVRLHTNGYTYIHITSIMQKIVNSSLWDNGMPLLVLFRSRGEGYGLLKKGTTNIIFVAHTVYRGCVEYEENIINELPDSAFSDLLPCNGNGATFLKFNKNIGWKSCHSGNELIVNFGKKHTVIMLKVAGSNDNNFKRILTKFKIRYSQDGMEWIIIYGYNSGEHIFERKITQSADEPEYISLPAPFNAQYMKIIPVDYKGLRYGGLKLDIVACRRRVREPRRWIKLNDQPVCFGSASNPVGQFQSISDVDTSHFKVVHKSGGTFSCGRHWGCSNHKEGTVYITNSANYKLAPCEDDISYHLGRQDTSSEFMIIPTLQAWFIKTLDTLKVRFKDEISPTVETCADVYGWGKTYPYRNLAISRHCNYGISCFCFGYHLGVLKAKLSCKEYYYFDTSRKLVQADTKLCLQSCTGVCSVEYTDCNVATTWTLLKNNYLKSDTNNRCIDFYDHQVDNGLLVMRDCVNAPDFKFIEGEGALFNDDNMYLSVGSRPWNNVYDYCKTLWSGQGSFLMFYSELDYYNFWKWCDKRGCGIHYVPTRLKFNSNTKDLGTMDGTPITYFLWWDGQGSISEQCLGTHKGKIALYDLPCNVPAQLICQKLTPENYTVPRYQSSTLIHTLMASGLHKVGTGYMGKGFHIGYNAHGKIFFALQTETDLYEGQYQIGYPFYKHLSLSWNKTSLNLYVDRVLVTSVGKMNREMVATPGKTFSNYLIIGGSYDYSFGYNLLEIADVKVWKRALTTYQIIEVESDGTIDFDKENDDAQRAKYYQISQWCTNSKNKNNLCYDVGQQNISETDLSERGCPANWLKWNGSCYYFSDMAKDFDEAQAFCREYGADMLNLESEEEFHFISSTVQSPGYDASYLIGLNDRNTEGDFQWTNGFNLNSSLMDHWGDDPAIEPNGGTSENCVYMVHGEVWQDHSCTGHQKFSCEKIGPFRLNVKPNSWIQHGADISGTWCMDSFTSIGTCKNADLVFTNNYFTFEVDLNPFVYIKRAILSFRYGDNVNTDMIKFTINVANVTLKYTDDDCTDDLIKTHRFGDLTEINLQGFGDNDIGAIDVTELVQWEVRNPDWKSIDHSLTFVLSQKDAKCSGGEEVLFDGASEMTLDIFYDEFKPHKFLSYFPTIEPGYYETSYLSNEVKSVSFWVWMSGKDDGVLTMATCDDYSCPLMAFVAGDHGKKWFKVSVNLNGLASTERKKIYFNVFNFYDNRLAIGLDLIETSISFLPDDQITLQNVPIYQHHNFVPYNPLQLNEMNLPSAILLYPFAGKSIYLKDYGPYQLDLSLRDCNGYLQSDWLGFLSNSLHLGDFESDTNCSVDSLEPIPSLIQSTFSILLHLKSRSTTSQPTIFQFGRAEDPIQFGVYTSGNKMFLRVTNRSDSIIGYFGDPLIKMNVWEYIGIVFSNNTFTLVRNNEIVGKVDFSIESFNFPDNLHFYRDPVLYGSGTIATFVGSLSCFQLYNKTISLAEIRSLKFCPVMQDERYYPYKCVKDGMPVFNEQKCSCPNGFRFVDRTCRARLVDFYHDELLYLSFDEGTEVDVGEFQYDQLLNFELLGSIINKAACFDKNNEVGILNSQCLSDFTNCEKGYIINFWVAMGNNNTHYDEVLDVLTIGAIKLSAIYYEDLHKLPTGFLQWKHDKCSYSFDLPIASWVFFSIHFNQTNMELYLNGILYRPDKQCEIPELLNAASAEITVGNVPFCLDELSVLKVKDQTDVADLYYKYLTGEGISSDTIYDTKAGIELEFTSADFNNYITATINEGVKNEMYDSFMEDINVIVHKFLTEIQSENTRFEVETFGNTLLSASLSGDNVIVKVNTELAYITYDWGRIEGEVLHNKRRIRGNVLHTTFLAPTNPIHIAVKETKPEPVINVDYLPDYKPYHICYYVFVTVESFNGSSITAFNETHYHNLDEIRIHNVRPHRWHQVEVSVLSHYGISRISNNERFFSYDSVNFEPPVIKDCVNVSHTSIFLTWEEYQQENFNNEYITFYVTWENIVNTSISYAYSDLTLEHFSLPQTLSMLIKELRPFMNYSVTLNTFNQFGVGLRSDVIYCLTNEWFPEGAPTISIMAINSTAIAINMSDPIKDLVNGIVLGYEVTYWSTEDSPVSMNFIREDKNEDHTKVTIGGLRKYFDYNFTIKAYTKIGMGPASEEMTVKTLEDMPSAVPTNFNISLVSHNHIVVSWENIHHLDKNGIMRHYNLYLAGMLANNSLYYVKKTVQFEEELSIYDWNSMNLFPATYYNITSEACTTPGCGPNITIYQRTNELDPNGVVQLSRNGYNETECLHFEWIDILPMEKRGVITHWNISFNKIENPWESPNDAIQYSVSPNIFNYSFYNLDNYTEYIFKIAGVTAVGSGPVVSVAHRTPTNVPSMAPFNVSGNNITSTDFRVWYEDLHASYHEGILLGYSVFYREVEEHELCTTYNNCTAMNETFCPVNYTCVVGVSCMANISTCDVVGAGLHTNYTVSIAAVTSAGIGILSEPIYVITNSFVNGNWTAWTHWGRCSASCGLGYYSRIRWCTNPEPQRGGKDCEGPYREQMPCNDFPCPTFYLAEPGIDCREQCKLIDPPLICATMIKTRNNKAVFEGARDTTNYTLTVDIECEEDTVTSEYSSPEHPYFDMDTQICSGFKNVPDRINCSINGTLGENIRRLCYCIDKDSMGYLEWAPWGVCTKTCGVGFKQRFRSCIMDEDECDKTQDTADCNIFQCPVHGEWGEWSEYGDCDRMCGFGVERRTRVCNDPIPAHRGDDCVGRNFEEIHGCNPYPCPIHGGWGEWEEKTICSTPCEGGVFEKVRQCNNPAPLYNGMYCPGNATEHIPCNEDVPCKYVDVNFVAKLVDFEWHYTMVYDTRDAYKKVKSSLNNALIAVLEDTTGTKHFLEMNIEGLSKGSVIANFTLTYTGTPFNEILVIQNAIDKVGYIDGLKVQYVNVTSNDVPNSPPNFTAISLTPYSINVRWEEAKNDTVNGQLYTYYIFYRNIKGENKTWKNIGSNSFSTVITHLNPGTLYGIRILVAIDDGNGIASKELDVETLEGVPFIAPPDFIHISMDYETVYVGWDLIPDDQVPGMLGGYEVTYRKYFDNVTTTLQVATDLLQRTIRGLKPNTWYWFEVGGFTTAGVGPTSLIVFQTPPGPPGVPPPNITKTDLYSTHSVRFTWDEIPPEEENGYMSGYKISYQLTRKAGMDVTVGNPPIVLTFDRFVFGYTITGLQPYSEYKVEIYGYASVGDGPANISIASTCICPPVLFTNFIESKPYTIVDKQNETIIEGLFPVLLNMIIKKVCINCVYQSKLYYDRTLTGYPSRKVNKKELKGTIGEGAHLNFPIFSKFELEKIQGTFPYIGIARSQGSAMVVVDPEKKTVGMLNILKAISKAWSVTSVAVLLAITCGCCFWFTEQSSNASDIDQSRFIVGAGQGTWLAYVTMTTVGYGDFVPTTITSKALMTAWVLIGLVTMGVVTGVISSGMTVGDMEEELMLYGTLTAALKDSFELQLAIVRNAKLDESRNYTQPLEILSAVKDGVVKVGLLDAVIASGYETEMLEMGLRVYKIIDTNSGLGVALSLGLEVAENDFKSYILANSAFISAFLKAQVSTLTPTLSRTESELISVSEVMFMLKYIGIIFGVLCVLGIIKSCMSNRPVKVEPEELKTTDKITPIFLKMVEDFHDGFSEKIEGLKTKHDDDISTLVTLRKNYERLLIRSGFEKQIVLDTFEKKRKKDLYAIKKKNRHAYYEANF